MQVKGKNVRYVMQVANAANYAADYPGHAFDFVASIEEAEACIRDLDHTAAGDVFLLWRVGRHDSEAEALNVTMNDAAHASYTVTVGPLGGVKTEQV